MTRWQRLTTLALSLLVAAAVQASQPRVRALGDGADYFEDDTAPLSWFAALIDYPDQLNLDFGDYDHDGHGSLNERLRGGGGGVTLRLDAAGRWGVLGLYAQEDLPAGAPGGAITLLGARRFGRLGLGLRAMLTSHFDGENSTEAWDRGESLYIHSFGAGARWDASDRLYGDLALEIVNTKSDAAEQELWSLPASSVWTGFAARTRWFWAASESVVLVPLADHRRDDRPVLSAGLQAPADQHAWQSSLGLGVNLLRDPDNLIVISGEWRWGTEEHERLRGQSTAWEYDASDLDYHEIHARAGLESRVSPWLTVRGSLQYLRLQREQASVRGELVDDDPDRRTEDRTIRVRTPITLGCSLHGGPFQVDLVFNGQWVQVPGTIPFTARPLQTGTYSGLSLRYLF
ncbi:MAG: hypothetical protein R3D98_11095 [Candidatus Krumholzibacteriia bacterium]